MRQVLWLSYRRFNLFGVPRMDVMVQLARRFVVAANRVEFWPSGQGGFASDELFRHRFCLALSQRSEQFNGSQLHFVVERCFKLSGLVQFGYCQLGKLS